MSLHTVSVLVVEDDGLIRMSLVEELENAGFTAVTDFAGGFKAWQENSEAVSECHSC